MQKIYLEKNIDLGGKLKDLISIAVDDSIDYKIESNGIRATGDVLITGEYVTLANNETFHETLELDILAPFEKIVDRRDFSIKIEDFDYQIEQGNLNIEILAQVHGVVVSEDRRIVEFADPVKEEEPYIDISEDEIEEIRKIMTPAFLEEIENTPSNTSEPILSEDSIKNPIEDDNKRDMIKMTFDDHEQTNEVSAAVLDDLVDVSFEDELDHLEEEILDTKETDDEEDVLIKGLEDLYEDIGSKYVSYRLYVVKADDTYASIAARYEVDIEKLKVFNQNKELQKSSLVVIPFNE